MHYFWITLLFASVTFAAPPSIEVSPDDHAAKFVVGQLPESIPESSGIIASRKHAGVFWTHNDSGNKPQIFAVDRGGKLLATYDIAAKNNDWEDIAIDDDCHLYISETGNNNRRARPIAVYRVDEPDPAKPVLQAPLRVNAIYNLRYPAEPFDCESLFIWKGYGYVISKHRDGAAAQMYRFPLTDRPLLTLEPVATLPIRSPVTAADISQDGREVVVLTVLGPNRFTVDGDPTKIAKAPCRSVTFVQPDMEGATFVPEGILATTESRHVLLFTNEMFDNPTTAGEQQVTNVTIAHTTKPVTIDADLTDWDTTATRQPLKFTAADPADSTRDRATLLTAWTADGLYVAATIPRAEPLPLPDEWFGGDVLELFVGNQAPNRAADYLDGDDRCYVGFEKAADGSRGNVVIRFPRAKTQPTGALATGRLNGNGTYTLEAFIPATTFATRKPLAVGQVIRFQASILARSPKRNWYISESNDDGAWSSPLKWAVATLKE